MGVCFVSIFFVGRLLQFLGNPRFLVGGDTPMYMPPEVARWSLVSFWGHGSRSWFVTFPFALFKDPARIAFFQHTFSFVSGALLFSAALTLVKSLRARAFVGIAVTLLLLRPDVVYFNSLLMSESIQISFLCLLIGLLIISTTQPRMRIGLLPVCGLLIFALCTMRIAFICLYLPLIALLARMPRAKRRERVQVGLLLLTCVFLIAATFHIDGNVNKKWGLDFAGNASLNGRTMQQVSLLGATQIGQDYLTHRIESLTVEKDCVASGFKQGEYWPGFAIRCPAGVQELTDGYEAGYLAHLLRHPFKAAGQHLPATYAAFASFDMGPEWKRAAPMSIQNVISLSDGASSVAPLLAIVMAAMLLFSIAMSRGQNRSQVVIVASLGISLIGVLVLSLVFSPIDTYRVCIAATLGICLTVWATASLWLDSRTQGRVPN